MKFIGEPNLLVKERKRKPMSTEIIFKPLCRFDANGEFETDDLVLIEKLKPRFKCEEKTCKYCGGVHDNKGQLMACAKKHKKEG